MQNWDAKINWFFKKNCCQLQKAINEILQVSPDSFIDQALLSENELGDIDNGNNVNDNDNDNDNGQSLIVRNGNANLKGRKKRGRKAKQTNQVDFTKQQTCEICTLHHATKDCAFYKKRLEIMKANKEKYQEVEARRCSLCGGINHQNRQCDLRKEAKEYYTQRNFS